MFGQDVIGEVALGEAEAGTPSLPPEPTRAEFWWETSAEAEFEWDESSHSEVEFGP